MGGELDHTPRPNRWLASRPWRRAPSPTGSIIGAELAPLRIRGRSVELTLVLRTRLSRDELWRRISDLPRFLTIDPLHVEITLMRPSPAVGVHLVLWHAVHCWRFLRFGKILRWRPREGYAFSDLSARGPRRGFPHAFFISIDDAPIADEAHGAWLKIQVRGRWTNPLVPLWIGRFWLTFIAREHARLLQNDM